MTDGHGLLRELDAGREELDVPLKCVVRQAARQARAGRESGLLWVWPVMSAFRCFRLKGELNCAQQVGRVKSGNTVADFGACCDVYLLAGRVLFISRLSYNNVKHGFVRSFLLVHVDGFLPILESIHPPTCKLINRSVDKVVRFNKTARPL